jgi:predicted transcriptional regulator
MRMCSGGCGRRLQSLRREKKTEHELPAHLVHVHPDDSLYTVVEKMATEHIHRVYVVSHERKPIRVIVQTDILREIIGK